MFGQRINRFHIKLIGLAALGICVFLLFFHVKKATLVPSSFSLNTEDREPWITVFVHGSFGSLLGFLSFSDVLHDRLQGTLYRNITKKMRDDDFFYKDQIILQRGLVRVEPTYDFSAIGKKYVTYPLIKAYQDILETINPGKEENYFYTFGWSGLISQNSRRFEVIRLYNA